MHNFSDEASLLKEIQLGNDKALEYLFKSYSPRLWGYAKRFIDDQELVRDIVQECYIRLWEKRARLKSISLSSLLFAMVRNSCLNHLKHRNIVEKYQIEYLANITGEERLYYVDFDCDTEHRLLYEELQEQIQIVINALPTRCREVFILSRFKGLKNREIAEKFQVSITAVEKHITRALNCFYNHFKDKYPTDVYIIIIAWLLHDF